MPTELPSWSQSILAEKCFEHLAMILAHLEEVRRGGVGEVGNADRDTGTRIL